MDRENEEVGDDCYGGVSTLIKLSLGVNTDLFA